MSTRDITDMQIDYENSILIAICGKKNVLKCYKINGTNKKTLKVIRNIKENYAHKELVFVT